MKHKKTRKFKRLYDVQFVIYLESESKALGTPVR